MSHSQQPHSITQSKDKVIHSIQQFNEQLKQNEKKIVEQSIINLLASVVTMDEQLIKSSALQYNPNSLEVQNSVSGLIQKIKQLKCVKSQEANQSSSDNSFQKQTVSPVKQQSKRQVNLFASAADDSSLSDKKKSNNELSNKSVSLGKPSNSNKTSGILGGVFGKLLGNKKQDKAFVMNLQDKQPEKRYDPIKKKWIFQGDEDQPQKQISKPPPKSLISSKSESVTAKVNAKPKSQIDELTAPPSFKRKTTGGKNISKKSHVQQATKPITLIQEEISPLESLIHLIEKQFYALQQNINNVQAHWKNQLERSQKKFEHEKQLMQAKIRQNTASAQHQFDPQFSLTTEQKKQIERVNLQIFEMKKFSDSLVEQIIQKHSQKEDNKDKDTLQLCKNLLKMMKQNSCISDEIRGQTIRNNRASIQENNQTKQQHSNNINSTAAEKQNQNQLKLEICQLNEELQQLKLQNNQMKNRINNNYNNNQSQQQQQLDNDEQSKQNTDQNLLLLQNKVQQLLLQNQQLRNEFLLSQQKLENKLNQAEDLLKQKQKALESLLSSSLQSPSQQSQSQKDFYEQKLKQAQLKLAKQKRQTQININKYVLANDEAQVLRQRCTQLQIQLQNVDIQLQKQKQQALGQRHLIKQLTEQKAKLEGVVMSKENANQDILNAHIQALTSFAQEINEQSALLAYIQEKRNSLQAFSNSDRSSNSSSMTGSVDNSRDDSNDIQRQQIRANPVLDISKVLSEATMSYLEKFAQMKETIEELQETNIQLVKTIERNKVQLNEQRNSLNRSLIMSQNLNETYKKAKKDQDEKLSQYETEFQKLKKKIQHLKTQKDEQKSLVEETIKKTFSSNQTIKRLKNEKEDLVLKVQSFEIQLSQKQKAIMICEKELQTMTESFYESDRKVLQKDNSIKDLKSKINEIKSEKSDLESKLSKKIQSLKQQSAQIKEQYEQQIADLQRKYENQKKSKQAIEKIMNENKNQKKEIEINMKKLIQSEKIISQQAQKLQSKQEELQQELIQQRQRLQIQKQGKQYLQEKIEQYKNREKKAKKDLAQIQKQRMDLQNLIHQVERQNQIQLSQKSQQIQSLLNKNQQLQQQLDAKDLKYRNKLQENNRQHSAQIVNLQKDLSSMKQQFYLLKQSKNTLQYSLEQSLLLTQKIKNQMNQAQMLASENISFLSQKLQHTVQQSLQYGNPGAQYAELTQIMDNKINELQTEVEKKDAEIVELLEVIQEKERLAEQTTQTMEIKINELQTEIQNKDTEIVELLEVVQEKQKLLSESSDVNTNTKAEEQAEVQSIQQNLHSLQAEKQQLQQQFNQIKSTESQLRENYTIIYNQYEQLQKELKQNDENLKTRHQQQIQRLKASMQKSINQQTLQNAQLYELVQELNKQIQQNQNDKAQLQKQRDSLIKAAAGDDNSLNQLQQLNELVRHLKEQNDRLQQELQKIKKESNQKKIQENQKTQEKEIPEVVNTLSTPQPRPQPQTDQNEQLISQMGIRIQQLQSQLKEYAQKYQQVQKDIKIKELANQSLDVQILQQNDLILRLSDELNQAQESLRRRSCVQQIDNKKKQEVHKVQAQIITTATINNNNLNDDDNNNLNDSTSLANCLPPSQQYSKISSIAQEHQIQMNEITKKINMNFLKSCKEKNKSKSSSKADSNKSSFQENNNSNEKVQQQQVSGLLNNNNGNDDVDGDDGDDDVDFVDVDENKKQQQIKHNVINNISDNFIEQQQQQQQQKQQLQKEISQKNQLVLLIQGMSQQIKDKDEEIQQLNKLLDSVNLNNTNQHQKPQQNAEQGLKQQIITLVQELQQKQTELQNQKMYSEILKEEKDKLIIQLGQNKNVCQELTEKHTLLQGECQQLKELSAELAQTIENQPQPQNDQITEMKQLIGQLEQQIKVKDKTLQQLKTQKADLEQLVTHLSAQLAEITDNIRQKPQSTATTPQIAKYNQMNEKNVNGPNQQSQQQLIQQKKQIQNQNLGLKEAISLKDSEIDTLKKELEIKQDELVSLCETLNSKDFQIQDLTKRLALTCAELQETSNQINDLLREKQVNDQEKNNKTEKSQNFNNQKDEEIAPSHSLDQKAKVQEVVTSQKKSYQSSNDIDEIKKQLSEAYEQIRNRRIEIDQLRKNLNDINAMYQERERKYEAKIANLEKDNLSVQNLKDKNKSLEENIKEVQLEVIELSSEKAELLRINDRLEKQLSTFQKNSGKSSISGFDRKADKSGRSEPRRVSSDKKPGLAQSFPANINGKSNINGNDNVQIRPTGFFGSISNLFMTPIETERIAKTIAMKK